ncbi:hypothetical protein PVL29_003716 [Vitis rotundifolia]|uniref:Uncharacterized protein n=1 Tax=Vitis rotundifolia TaxID=103349 RepID=A0AA39ADS1_VITRO|nr:hypothetical protein PVL29_003716 [Vitis rotundifolia]
MVESFAFNIADRLLGKATSLALQQVGLAWSVYNELQNLKATLSTIRTLTNWLGKLKDCFYDAKDVLDEFEYDTLLREVVNEGGIKRKVRHFFSNSNPFAFRFKMGNKMKEIRERLDKVAADADKFNLKKMGVNVPMPVLVLNRKRENYSFVRAFDLLMQSSDEENVYVLPLVGIGGLGKTTLAKLVYNDGRVVAHFQTRMWVCVSDEFDVKRLIKKIITSATHGKCDDLPMDELACHLRNVLDDNKFLLILDDVWSKNRDKWLELKALLDGGAKGSKIIVTTRDKLVASVMGTCSPYELKGLSDEECLLVGIGKDIVKKCKGLPSAVRTLEGLLYLKTEENDWVRQKEGDVLPTLKLSYDELPFDLKQCFASCLLFPKNMGQGLNQPSEQNKEMENIDNRYIDELIQKSFFQDCSMLNFDSENIFTKVWHVSILETGETKEEETISRFLGQLNNVRTISFRDSDVESKCESFVITCLLRFKYMRVLDVKYSSFEELPNSICNLKHLRYLDLRDNVSIKRLPNSICELYHLQILHLFGCDSLEELPRDIGKMMSLKHLIVTTQQMAFPYKEREIGRRCPHLSSLPKHLLVLENLTIVDCEILDLGNRNEEKEGNIQVFGSLRNLFISGLPKLQILPKWLFQCENFRALLEEEESLSRTQFIIQPEGMMDHLTVLRQLKIIDCPQLSSLIKRINHLPALTHLTIEYCPELAKRCEPRTGEDWNKIAHVKDIYVDGQKIESTIHNQVRASGLDEGGARTSGEMDD